MAEISQRVQDAIVILCTSLYAARQKDEVVRAAGDIVCRDLRRRLSGRRPSDRDLRATTRLGEQVAAGKFKSIEGVWTSEVLMSYQND